LAASASLAACGGGDDKPKKPVPNVGFVVVKATAVPLQTSLGGRTVAFETSEVRPQINGMIRSRLFTEGGMVGQGQPLFQIDASLYRASVNQASANLQSAQATAEAMSAKAERYKPLAAIEAVSKQDYTDALAQARQARAAVAQSRAALDTAQINLRYTNVPAPISGRIGRSLFTSGALVSVNQTAPLAVIQRLDPIYVDMQQSSADLLALRRALAGGGSAPGSTQVRLQLEDGSEYGYAGVLQFSEMMVNEATGTVTLRARFPNPQGLLLPGMFVQARFNQTVEPSAYLVPQQAVQRDFGGDALIFVVGPDSKVLQRKVTAGRTLGTDWVVTSGLKSGDRVITQGVATLKPGMPVKAVPASAADKLGQPKGSPGTPGSGGKTGG
jgi:membrane fusion protein (multidrug efflux system)